MSSVVYLMIRDDFSVLSFGFADQNVILWSPVKFGGLWSRRLGVGRSWLPCARYGREKLVAALFRVMACVSPCNLPLAAICMLVLRLVIGCRSVRALKCWKRKVSHEPSLLLHVVYGPTLYQGKLQTLARPLLYSIKAFGAAARAIRHSKSSMGFVYSLTGHVSVENKSRPHS
ncbi:unnamed protein product [Microthlaspi erraticum]|uniref:Uncharacterized protein n=1 Tax=Microthlaspi erraticum TaxID=1685480 RepID=A0A6D2I8G2_9BRAS|nr:unnamed protein product [Microthlaspi erraticum]